MQTVEAVYILRFHRKTTHKTILLEKLTVAHIPKKLTTLRHWISREPAECRPTLQKTPRLQYQDQQINNFYIISGRLFWKR